MAQMQKTAAEIAALKKQLKKDFSQVREKQYESGTLNKGEIRYKGLFVFIDQAKSGNYNWGIVDCEDPTIMDSLKPSERFFLLSAQEHAELVGLDGEAQFYIGHPQSDQNVNLIRLETFYARQRRRHNVSLRDLGREAVERMIEEDDPNGLILQIAARKKARDSQQSNVGIQTSRSLSLNLNSIFGSTPQPNKEEVIATAESGANLQK